MLWFSFIRRSLLPRPLYFTLFSRPSQGNGEYLCLDRLTSYIWWLIFCGVIVAASVAYLGSLLAALVVTGCCCCFCGNRCCKNPIDSEAAQALLLGPPLALSLLFMTALWVVIAVVKTQLLLTLFPFDIVSPPKRCKHSRPGVVGSFGASCGRHKRCLASSRRIQMVKLSCTSPAAIQTPMNLGGW